jgi:hypothetical protein
MALPSIVRKGMNVRCSIALTFGSATVHGDGAARQHVVWVDTPGLSSARHTSVASRWDAPRTRLAGVHLEHQFQLVAKWLAETALSEIDRIGRVGLLSYS